MDVPPLPIQIIPDTSYLVLMGLLIFILLAWAIFSCIMQVLEYKERQKRDVIELEDPDPRSFASSAETQKIPAYRRRP